MDRAIWNDLAHFQSSDLVRRNFKERYQRELSADKSLEIVSSFVQAQEYFSNAESSAETVKPLLLYYGVLSLARGAILYLSPRAREATLKPAHGLAEVDWKNGLAQSQSDPLQLAVKVTEGTFHEFVEVATRPHQTFTPTFSGGVHVNVGPPLPSPGLGDLITLDDVVARTPALSDYERIVQRPAKHQVGMIIAERTNYQVYIFHLDYRSGEAEGEIRKRFQIPGSVALGRGPFVADGHNIASFVYSVSMDDHPRPAFERSGTKSGNLIIPMANGSYLSPILRGYLNAYILGMLVRYFPSRWMGMIRNQRGDAAVPLLRSSLDLVEREFPKEILQLLYSVSSLSS